MHAHLKNFSQQVKYDRNKFLMNLRSIISATQKKLKKYYEIISSKEELYFNLELYFNSCDKLNYYKINKSLIFIYVALLIARFFFSLLFLIFEYNRVFSRSFLLFLIFEYSRVFSRSLLFFS